MDNISWADFKQTFFKNKEKGLDIWIYFPKTKIFMGRFL